MNVTNNCKLEYYYNTKAKKLSTNSNDQDQIEFCNYYNGNLEKDQLVTMGDYVIKQKIKSFIGSMIDNNRIPMQTSLPEQGNIEASVRGNSTQGNHDITFSIEQTDPLTSTIISGDYTMIAHTVPALTIEELKEAFDLWSDYSYKGKSTGVNKNENSIGFSKGSEVKINDNFYIRVTNNWVEFYAKTNYHYTDEEIEEVHNIASALNHFIRYSNDQIGGSVFAKDMSTIIEQILQKEGIDTSKEFMVNGTELYMKDGCITKKNESNYSYIGMPESVIKKAISRYEQSLLEVISAN